MKKLSLTRFVSVQLLMLLIVQVVNVFAGEASISNSQYRIDVNTQKGTWNCSTIDGEQIIDHSAFLIITEDGEKYYSSSSEYQKSVEKGVVDGVMGSGEKLEIRFTAAKSNMPEALVSLILYQNKSYFSIEVEAINTGADKIVIREIQPIKLDSKQKGSLKFMGSTDKLSVMIDGSTPGNECKLFHLDDKKEVSGFTMAALYNMQSKKSLIIGSLDNGKSVNLIAMRLKEEKENKYCTFDLTLSSYFAYLPLKSSELATTGQIMIDLPDNVFDGLERYADMIAKINNVTLDKKPMCGWCSWYHIYPDVTEAEVIKNANFLAENLKDYGLEYMQVDRGNIKTGTDWLTTNKKFPHDMKWLAEQIHNRGFKAGVWTAPFWLGRDSKFYNEDMVLWKIYSGADQEGNRRRHWASWGDVIDSSNDEVIDYMKNFVDVIINDWDYDYLKNDYLVYGIPEIRTLEKILLEKGEIVDGPKYPRKNMDITPFEAYKNAVKAIKEAAGEETFIMGCNAILFNTVGYTHACRVGGDIQSKACITWNCGTSKTVRTSSKRYFYNGRTMWIDPDALVIWDPASRGPFTIDEARTRAALASFFGGMMMTSDRMYELPPERVEILRNIMPPYPHTARPIDLFEKEMPELWLWDIKKDFDNWHVLGVFNYSEETMKREISYDYLGLDTTKQYIMYEFWKEKLPTRSSRYYYRTFMPFQKDMFVELAPHSCQVIAIHEKKNHPQVISTNRHLTQGAIDLEDVRWDNTHKTLSGISEVIKNDDYQLVVTLPANMDFIKAAVVEADISCQANLDDADVDRYNTVRVNIKSPETQKVNWSVSFKETEE